MDRPLREHIKNLEHRLKKLNETVMANRLSQPDRNRVEAEIRAATLALSHFQTALELESSLSPN
jgi:hypothetical protein